MSDPDLRYARAVARGINEERARLEIAMTRLFAACGRFDGVVAATNSCLRALANRIQAEGGDTGGWIG